MLEVVLFEGINLSLASYHGWHDYMRLQYEKYSIYKFQANTSEKKG